MDTDKIAEKVKAKLRKKAKLKMLEKLKKLMPPKKYTTLNKENAIALAKDQAKRNYWKFEVPKDVEIRERTQDGDKHIDVKIKSEELKGKDYDWFTVWYDPVEKELIGDYKPYVGLGSEVKSVGKHAPLTEENAIKYVKNHFKDNKNYIIPDNPKIEKFKDGEIDVITVHFLIKDIDGKGKDSEWDMSVWYEPRYKGLYGES